MSSDKNGFFVINNDKIEGFNFGRFDLRVSSLDNLYKGKDIKIMEVNGANSEPAHIYDPEMKLFTAYKAVFQHWNNLYEVSIQNAKKGHTYTPFLSAYSDIRYYFKNR